MHIKNVLFFRGSFCEEGWKLPFFIFMLGYNIKYIVKRIFPQIDLWKGAKTSEKRMRKIAFSCRSRKLCKKYFKHTPPHWENKKINYSWKVWLCTRVKIIFFMKHSFIINLFFFITQMNFGFIFLGGSFDILWENGGKHSRFFNVMMVMTSFMWWGLMRLILLRRKF